MEKIKQLGKIGYYIFFGILIFIALVVVVSAFPIKGNIQLKVVESGSMEPIIKTGSIVLVKPASYYKIGDIITFNGNFKNAKGQKIPITHRIIEMRAEQGNPIYITKGEANEDKDSKEILQNQVIGKVYFSIPYLGYAIKTARTTYGFLALIIIPSVIIMWSHVEKIYIEIKKIREKKVHSSELKNL